MLGKLLVLAAVCVLVPAVAAARSASGHTAAQDLAWFNAQRAANGIPAGIVENGEWSADCDKHVAYLEQVGNGLTHEEDPSSPYYTDDGEWGGTHSVLATGTWRADANPWETAPIHLAQMMSPQLAEMGVADRDGYVCATTWPGMDRPLPDTTSVVTYPGDGTTIYPSETAAESPFTPEDIVGLKGETGTNLYVYEWGPVLGDYAAAARTGIASASLTGPDGPVEVKWVDGTTAQIGPYLPNASGILMPVKPLAGGATYTASVQFSDGTAHTWSFTTGKPSSGQGVQPVGKGGGSGSTRLAPNSVVIRFLGNLHILVSSRGPLKKVTVSYRHRPVAVRAGRPTASSWLGTSRRPLARGTSVCATSGGRGFKTVRACKAF
ncbi:MAG TPA: hypothetical protein VHC67_17920 [Gaiellaceae bacterium]|nr:hypothetical protein [Gaiellaceae bacterium]